MTNTPRKPSLNFEIGYEDGKAGREYFCPSKGNKFAEEDYALGFFAGEKNVPRVPVAKSEG